MSTCSRFRNSQTSLFVQSYIGNTCLLFVMVLPAFVIEAIFCSRCNDSAVLIPTRVIPEVHTLGRKSWYASTLGFNSLWLLIENGGGCLTHTSCFVESQHINVSSFDKALKQLKCFTSTQYHSNLAPIIIKIRRHFFVISSMQGKIASSSMNCTVSCFMSISPRFARFTRSCATHRLSFPPLKEKNTGNPFRKTFFILISAAVTTSMLDSHRFTAISVHHISGRLQSVWFLLIPDSPSWRTARPAAANQFAQ